MNCEAPCIVGAVAVGGGMLAMLGFALAIAAVDRARARRREVDRFWRWLDEDARRREARARRRS